MEGLRYESRQGRWVLAVAVLGSGVAFLEATVVNVALPAIGEDLGAGTGGLQRILNGYLLTLAALILLGGSLGDRYGRRLVFQVGVIWFTLASAICALAPSVELLVAARVLQGIGEHSSPPAASPSSRRRSARRTGRARSARGRASAASPPPSGRCSADG